MNKNTTEKAAGNLQCGLHVAAEHLLSMAHDRYLVGWRQALV